MSVDWGRGDIRRLSLRDYPSSVLALVDERQGGRFCVFCRQAGIETPESETPLELDHKQPLSLGGDNAALNLQWACKGHNRSRGNRKAPHEIPPWMRGPQRALKRNPRTGEMGKHPPYYIDPKLIDPGEPL